MLYELFVNLNFKGNLVYQFRHDDQPVVMNSEIDWLWMPSARAYYEIIFCIFYTVELMFARLKNHVEFKICGYSCSE